MNSLQKTTYGDLRKLLESNREFTDDKEVQLVIRDASFTERQVIGQLGLSIVPHGGVVLVFHVQTPLEGEESFVKVVRTPSMRPSTSSRRALTDDEVKEVIEHHGVHGRVHGAQRHFSRKFGCSVACIAALYNGGTYVHLTGGALK